MPHLKLHLHDSEPEQNPSRITENVVPIRNKKPALISQIIFLQYCSTRCQPMPSSINSNYRTQITKKVSYKL